MDRYELNLVVLENFCDRIGTGGSLIIDHFGHHSGARKATDEFFAHHKKHLHFRPVNYSCIAATVF
jgi:hypothetical protein